MLGNSHFDRFRQTFADQFAADSRGYVYRKGQKGPPIRVSEMERNEFVATFDKRIRYAKRSILPATLVVIPVMAWLIPSTDSPVPDVAISAWIGAICLSVMATFYWAWNAPSRELQRRTPEGAALTKKEARALALSKITYGQLALAAAMGQGSYGKCLGKPMFCTDGVWFG